MTSVQVLAAELTTHARAIEQALALDQGTTAVEMQGRAQRVCTALGALLGAPPAAVELRLPAARPIGSGDRCPRCQEKLRLVPSAGFGTAVSQICGACGYEPATIG